jgi:formylglycine-generating enzyme required for sulfatase activity
MKKVNFTYPTLDPQGQVNASTEGTAEVYEIDLGGVALEMAAIPGGYYQMGSARSSGYPDEHPLHLVNIAPFYLGRTLVRQDQWQAVMGKLPPVRFRGPNRPIEQIRWRDAEEFCRRLTRKTGLIIRLPNESEWEYACRAGTVAPFSCGATITTEFANYVGEGYQFAQEPPGIYRHGTTDVGSFPPNGFGLWDMHGNLWEWCADTWHEDYTGAPATQAAWVGSDTDWRVARGGSWHEPPQHCRSATRLRVLAGEREEFIGMRAAMNPF